MSLVLLLCCCLCGAALAGEPDAAQELFRCGEYARAYEAALPLARQGEAGPQYVAGILLLEGRGVPRDALAGVDWLRRSAEGGDPRAQSALGRCYEKGLGVRRDVVRAYMWHSIAVAGAAEAAEAREQLGARLSPGQKRRGEALAKAWLSAHGR
jgi:TPR repeat protein